MYVFLLILGAVTSLAGLALVASGVAEDGLSAITPGIIAVVGGLVLIGLAVLVRELQRIERALAARPMPRAARPGEVSAAAAAGEQPSVALRIPFPPKPKVAPHPQVAHIGAANGPAPAEETASERARERFPTLVRLAPVVEGTDVSLVSLSSGGAPARAEEAVGEADNRAAVGGAASTAASARAAPRRDSVTRASGAREPLKASMFDSFWPKGQRPKRDTQSAAVHATAEQAAPVIEPAPGGEAAADTRPAAGESAASVTVLKSGVVEGMAYTLYSDGSIEAQLPQGTLRFGSITELRHHIESDS